MPNLNIIGIKGSIVFAIGVCMIVSLSLHVFSHRLKVGRVTKKFGLVGSLDGSSGSYQQPFS